MASEETVISHIIAGITSALAFAAGYAFGVWRGTVDERERESRLILKFMRKLELESSSASRRSFAQQVSEGEHRK